MNLIDKQKAFPVLLASLIRKAVELDYELTLGEVWRPKETAYLYAKQGIGAENSLHCIRLAIDINLFKQYRLLTKTEDYKVMGEYWESLSHEDLVCAWGGRFADGNHFSIEHNGVR